MTEYDDYDNEENAINKHKNDAESYFKHKIGQCFICPNQPLAEDMIQVSSDIKTWYICDMCHKAYYYHGYTQKDIAKALADYEKRRKYLPDKELKDIKRRDHKPITIEEVCELCWKLTYEKKWEDFF